MNLKFWSWELKFWTLLVLRRSVSHRWFPSPKQISRFHNQNLCENLNRAIFAQTSWSLVKAHIKANNCRIILFFNFVFSNEEINPKNGIYAKNWARQVLLENFDFLVKICAKVNFLGIGPFAQFPSFKWRNGSQNRNVLKKLNGTGHFWKFWLFGQSQSSTWSKLFFFFFVGGSDRVRFPGRSGSNRGNGGWRHVQRASVRV